MSSPNQASSPDPIIRTGVIGLGGRGRYFARMYDRQGHPGFKLVAVCDADADARQRASQDLADDVAITADMHEMLARPDLDAVLVATNDPDHVEPTVAALRAGKHVLVEKPLCQSVSDARRMLAEARQASGIFMIGFELRAVSVFRQTAALLREGRIGEVKVGHAFDNVSVGGNYFFHDPARQKSFYRSLLLQKACHSIDLLNWFMGADPARVYAIGGAGVYGQGEAADKRCRDCDRAETCPYRVAQSLQMDYGVTRETPDYCVWSEAMDLDDHSLLAITYANGTKATFHECHFTPDYTREFWLVGDQGKLYAYYDNPGRFLIRIEYSHDPERRTEEWKPPYTGGGHGGGDNNLRDEFYQRIVDNDPPTEAQISAYYSTALAICAQQSIDTDQPVDIPPLAADE